MNYQLEFTAKEPNSPLVFKTIFFGSFKVNIIERYKNTKHPRPKLDHVVFKIRTPDDEIVNSRTEAGRIKLKGEDFKSYLQKAQILDSYEYKNKLINNKEAELEYVHFILRLVISNYQLN